ncbi:MAG: hypothetical protein M3R24_01140 [Chloroflexota bacterium]|nr:hypothetical protein [Chloroflexota bacterium]
MFKGLFELQSPHDLLMKLRHDYRRIEESPLDQYAAFDFFVTAEHMVDWQYPHEVDNFKRTGLRNSNVLLQVCSHIANGSKHFQATAKRHDSVKNAQVHKGAFQRDAFQADAFDVSRLVVQLQGQAAQEFGELIDVLELARRVLEFWETYKKH